MKKLDSCGCCEGTSKETPLKVYNRPNLPAIAYRVGDHTQFKESLLTTLSDPRLTALHRLTTRSDDDFTIALLDAWAVVSDVLTFYQERIANESYLGTATEQLSIVELARLIGYELRPGVAASTPLAFTIEEATLALGQIAVTGNTRGKEDIVPTLIPVGSKVQSIPGPDEAPQIYETVEKIEARPEWNAMKPRMGQAQTGLLAANLLNIVVVKGATNDLKSGQIVLLNSNTLKKILKVVIDEEEKTTTLHLASNPSYSSLSYSVTNPPTGNSSFFPNKTPLTSNVLQILLQNTWREEDLTLLIQSQGWSFLDVKEGFAKKLAQQSALENVVSVFRKRAFPFGHNALKQVSYTGTVPDIASIWTEWNVDENTTTVYLDTAYEQILEGSHLAIQQSGATLANTTAVLASSVDFVSLTRYGMSGKTTKIGISPSQNWAGSGTIASLRGTTIHAQSEPLTLAESPIMNTIQGGSIMLSSFFYGLKKGQSVMIYGERTDLAGTYGIEHRLLKEVLIIKGFTTIVLDKPLSYQYIRKTVSVNANIANATHGETVKEVLGSGDARKAFQKFMLKQPPLTFTSAATPSGTQTTLEIRVNDLLWREVPSLFERKPNEHIYITRQDDLGKTTVIFGDGKNGARLPTGQENIRATYRKGIGVSGLLKAHQLSQLLSRPLGAKAVTNPFNTEGSQDREQLADARQNATLTMFTLGRIVSLKDYEDFARAFAGIAKALATWTWQGNKRCIYLTVAGYNGATVAESSQLYSNLLNAIHSSGIPDVPVFMKSYTPRFFRLSANIAVHPDYIADNVLAAVKTALRDQFSFAKRGFGQSVALSEVVATMQNVAGVVAVDLDTLYRSDALKVRNNILFANAPTATAPAELLTLDTQPLDLNLMS